MAGIYGISMDEIVAEAHRQLRARDEAHVRAELRRLGIPEDEAASRCFLRTRIGDPGPPEVVVGPPPPGEVPEDDEHERWAEALSSVARDDETLSDALDRLLDAQDGGEAEEVSEAFADARRGWETDRAAADEETAEGLRNALDHVARSQALLFALFPQLNDDEAEQAIPREAVGLRSALSEAGCYVGAALDELRRRA